MPDLPPAPVDLDRLQQERNLYLRLLEIAHTEEIEPLLEDALSLAVKATGAERGHIHVFRQDGDEDEWSMVLNHRRSDDDKPIRTVNMRSIEAEVLRSGRVVHTNSAELDPRFQGSDSVRGIEAVLCAPLGTEPPIGVLYLYGSRRGPVFDSKDVDLAELLARHLGPSVRALADRTRQRQRKDFTAPWRQRLNVEGLVGRSEALADVFAFIASVAPLEAGVLLTGASGTGKSAVARAIHENSGRKTGPFIEVNCAALPDTLVESELFGAKQGAHSAAMVDRAGQVAAAEGGTLFLDEIGELPLQSQAKLLSLIERKTYNRLGDNVMMRANIRIVAATNADLLSMVDKKTFREDLYFRLSVVPHRVPSLAERVEDLDELCDHFRDAAAQRNNLPRLPLSPRARIAVHTTSWPGNVRHLANKIEFALIQAATRGEEQIQVHHLFAEMKKADEQPEPEVLSYQEATRKCQEAILRQALERANGNVAETARQLDITRAHVYNLMRSFGIK